MRGGEMAPPGQKGGFCFHLAARHRFQTSTRHLRVCARTRVHAPVWLCVLTLLVRIKSKKTSEMLLRPSGFDVAHSRQQKHSSENVHEWKVAP